MKGLSSGEGEKEIWPTGSAALYADPNLSRRGAKDGSATLQKLVDG